MSEVPANYAARWDMNTWRSPVLVLFILGILATTVCGQTIKIRLVNGRNGRPIANSCVNVWVGSERTDAMAVPTDKDGIATLRLTDNGSEINTSNHWKGCGSFGVLDPVVKYDDDMRINVGYVLCQPRKPDYSWLSITHYSTKELIQTGIVSPNTCGKATVERKPGELTIFVRPLTWWERMKE